MKCQKFDSGLPVLKRLKVYETNVGEVSRWKGNWERISDLARRNCSGACAKRRIREDRCLVCRGIWQNDANRCSLPDHALRFDPASVKLRDVFYDR